MKKLYFVRHGETEFNRGQKFAGSTDVELTSLGHEQAKQTAKNVAQKGLAIDAIVSSPLTRARQTAQHIAEHLDYPTEAIIIHDNLMERSFGVFEGRSDLRVKTRYQDDEAAIDEYEGVETLAELQARAEAALEYLYSLPYDTILVVGHGSHGRALRRAIYNEPLNERGRSYANAELVEFI